MTSQETHNALYVAADTAARAEDWPTLWSLREELRGTDLWVGSYGPACAIAGWHLDREAASALLDELIEAGFHQPELFGAELAGTWARETGWAARERRMRENVPPPPIELLSWPDHEPLLALALDRLPPEREALLRERLPARSAGAWETALTLLDWTAGSWEHANGHVDDRDAVVVLDRVAAGERFACVEYAIVLSQALNASEIPARTLDLTMRDHHTGAGRGHVVSEAWIDDLARWILLDGQNGAWWGDDEPLGVVELIARHAEGRRPSMRSRSAEISEDDEAAWFWYFAGARTTGLAWVTESFVPVFQTTRVHTADRLVRGTTHVAPDLSLVSTSVVDDEGPALVFHPVHPYAEGVVVRSAADAGIVFSLAPAQAFRLDLPPGEHAFEVSTVSPYGALGGSGLRLIVRHDGG